MKYLIFGNGYIGNKFLENLGNEAAMAHADIGNIDQVNRALDEHQPDVVINTAGKTGKPNVDWCEDHKEETMYSNVAGPLVLAKACMHAGARMVHIGSGCIYYQNDDSIEFKETDKADFAKIESFYSKTKFWSEQILDEFPILQLRLRMPVDAEPNPRNLIWKIAHYNKIVDVPNSISIIPDFIEAAKTLISKEKTGIYNVVNPGAVRHPEILELYKQIVDPNHNYELINLEELDTIVKAGRSNCVLSTKKLEDEGIVLKPAIERIEELLHNYKNLLNNS